MVNRPAMLNSPLHVHDGVIKHALASQIRVWTGSETKSGKSAHVPKAAMGHFGAVRVTTALPPQSRNSLWKHPERLKDAHSLLPISGVNRFLRSVPFKVGSIPPKIVKCPKSIWMWWNSDWAPQAVKDLPDPRDFFMANGSWEHNYQILCSTARGTAHSATADSLSHVIKWVAHLNMPHMHIPTLLDLRHVSISGDTFPGFMTSYVGRMFGEKRAQSKSSMLRVATKVAEQIWMEIISQVTLDHSLWACGGRAKLNQIGSKITSWKEVKARLILMPELPQQMIQMVWAQLWTREMSTRKTPFAYGLKSTHAGWEGVFEIFKDCSQILEGDFSAFDTRVSEAHMVTAFRLLRMCWPAGRAVDRFFVFFMSSFIHKAVLTPGGYVYRLSHGVPSGSCWTTIIDGLVNWIVWMDAIRNYPPFRRAGLGPDDVALRIGGDDFLLGFKRPVSFSVSDLRYWIRRRHGMSLDDSTALRVLHSPVEGECASFYKVILLNGVPNIRTLDLYKQIVVPETSLTPTFDLCKYVISRAQSPPGCTTTVEVMASLCAFLDLIANRVISQAPQYYPVLHVFDRTWNYPDDLGRILHKLEKERPDPKFVTAQLARFQSWIASRWAELYMVDVPLHPVGATLKCSPAMLDVSGGTKTAPRLYHAVRTLRAATQPRGPPRPGAAPAAGPGAPGGGIPPGAGGACRPPAP
jgi:hypothetical protein